MRVLVSCVALEGHFRPLLPLAQALAAAGHEVSVATGADRGDDVRAAGFAHLSAGMTAAEAREPAAAKRRESAALPPGERRRDGFSGIFGLVHAPPKLPQLLEALRARPVDVVVHESADLAAPIAAAALGLPTVHQSWGAMVPLAILERAGELVEPLWRGEGLEPEQYAGVFRGLFVDLSPPSFAWEHPPGERVRLRPASPEPADAPAWLDELGRPLAYVTLGTIFNEPGVLRTLLGGLDGVSALVTTGRDVDPAELGQPPPGVHVERFVPQAQVLSRCAVVVTHGGSGTVLGALAYGVPLVLVPQGADQFDNAARCEAAGAAVVVPPEELTTDSVGAALQRVLLEPSFGAAAGALQAEIAAMPAPDKVVTAIEEYVSRG